MFSKGPLEFSIFLFRLVFFSPVTSVQSLMLLWERGLHHVCAQVLHMVEFPSMKLCPNPPNLTFSSTTYTLIVLFNFFLLKFFFFLFNPSIKKIYNYPLIYFFILIFIIIILIAIYFFNFRLFCVIDFFC